MIDKKAVTMPEPEQQGQFSAWHGYKTRYRPRTFPYAQQLPYATEDEADRQRNLDEIVKRLYVAVRTGDFAHAGMHWTRELRAWLGLKFDLRVEQRVRLARVYYELALAPGVDMRAAERFASTFVLLLKKNHYVTRGQDLLLDWRPIFRELKLLVLPADSGAKQPRSHKTNHRLLAKICASAQLYFDPREIFAVLQEILPYFTTSPIDGAFAVAGLLNLLFPTAPPDAGEMDLLPQAYLPTLFHVWALVSRSKVFDATFLDLFSRLARDHLVSAHTPFGEYGVFDQAQASTIFTAILRLLAIPVGQANSPYNETLDEAVGTSVYLERDAKKHPVATHIARWICMSLSPSGIDHPDSILANLEALIQATETFFHPSNQGAWTRTLSQLVHYLCDFFVLRWNREQSGELQVPADRCISQELKRRFVLCLREVVFMGIFAKSGAAMDYSLSSLRNLAFLEPDLILPGALQRIYPSLQGLVEVHRTTSSLRALQVLSHFLLSRKGYRCHVTSLLGLALPGIDANDLDKTLYSLSFIQSVCYGISLEDTSAGQDNLLAMEWVTSEIMRMETTDDLKYGKLDAAEEEMILKSSTANLGEFVTTFLGKVFTLLENLPDASRTRSGSPEENVINTLPAAFQPFLAALSPELYDMALTKLVEFIGNHVIHQARDAMAFICSAMVKTNPDKALTRLVPTLVGAIRAEITDNGAASTRNASGEILPRDRALVWHVSMLTMSVVHVGKAILQYRDELMDLVIYLQEHCKGNSTLHVYNLSHHILLTLTGTYTMDWRSQLWIDRVNPHSLEIQWHQPNEQELDFACDLALRQGGRAVEDLRNLIRDASKIHRSGKEWSDAISRNLLLLRLLVSGISLLLRGCADSEESVPDTEDTDPDERPIFTYPTGRPDHRQDEMAEFYHSIGTVLHETHTFLVQNQEDDVSCFGPLYNAYRSWFIDVGLERSARVLDRNVRLLSADTQPYKISGLRKKYPRSLLVRRANVYHLQRLAHNAYPRPSSKLAKQLLFDLAASSVSSYTDVRRQAQSAGESACKAIIGSRTLVIPGLVEAFAKAAAETDAGRIKGCMYALLFSSLLKPVGRDWKHAASIIKSYLAASATDRASVQRLCSTATIYIMDIGRPLERMAILDKSVVDLVAPVDDVEALVSSKKEALIRKRSTIEEKKTALSQELVEMIRSLHWKQASRSVAVLLTMGLRFEGIASPAVMELLTNGSVDEHPSLRTLYQGAFGALLSLIEARAMADHQYEEYLLNHQHLPTRFKLAVDPATFLDMFKSPEAEYYVDQDHSGWLVWTPNVVVGHTNPRVELNYDKLEEQARGHIASLLTSKWYGQLFENMKQEAPEHVQHAESVTLSYTFDLMYAGLTAATFDDIKTLVPVVYGDGSDKFQHRALAQILGALLIAATHQPAKRRTEVWEWVFPQVIAILQDGLNAENMSYWVTFLQSVLQGKDPRRNWPLVDWLASFRLDMQSNAAFKESAKIRMLQVCLSEFGWHFQLDKPLIDDFLAHIDHPYKGVREAMAQALESLCSSRYHESFDSVTDLIRVQKHAGSLGQRPYQPTVDFEDRMDKVFTQLEQWRLQGMESPSSYTSGGKTMMLWMSGALNSHDCIGMSKFLPKGVMPHLLHMMDIKDDPELQSLAYAAFCQIPNVPYLEQPLIEALVDIGRNSKFWHQRLRVLINMQVIYFRLLFLMSPQMQQDLLSCVTDMLQDSQLEVRLGAASTLSGMVRCSPTGVRTRVIAELEENFTQMLDQPKMRHAAVLGLGALVQAFPYSSPPPAWIPRILTTLACRANNDPGMVGQSVKTILSDFKKTRQDTWQTDLKAFTTDQAEHLDGVLWKSYFA